MNATQILKNVNESIEAYAVSDYGKMMENLYTLRREMREQIMAESAKADGKREEQKHANRILKRLQKYLDRQCMNGASGALWNNGTQLIFDSYCAIRMKSPLPVQDAVNVSIADQVEGFVNAASHNMGAVLELPQKNELKSILKLYKAGDLPLKKYDFGEGLPAVDAEFLLDVLSVVGGGATAIASTDAMRGIYISGANGDAVLMPVRK